jgi:formylmethanofuran dehydrogenase subunit B
MTVTIHKDVVCAFCGALCDDLEMHVEDNKVVQVKNVCIIGKNKALHGDNDKPPLSVNGRQVSLGEAYDEAARILSRAKSPLIYGFSSTVAEANRVGVELAEILRGTLDNCSSYCHGPSVLARQHVGLPTCTLGEAKNRADLVIFWGANPMESHMRHFSRYSVQAKGMYTPQGRQNRKLVVVDVRPTPSSKNADMFLQITPGSDYEIATVMRAIVNGLHLENLQDDSLVGGVPLSELRKLADMIKNCSYGVVFFGIGITQSQGKDLNVEQLVRLVCDCNGYTRFYAVPMRGHANVNGNNQVFTWQTGYPLAISFFRGYPRFNPGEFSVIDMLNRGDLDAALIVATDPAAHLPHTAVKALQNIPTIVLDPVNSLTTPWANVVIPVATCGLSAEGTYYRMDNVPIRLKKILDSPWPTDQEVLQNIKERVLHAKNH